MRSTLYLYEPGRPPLLQYFVLWVCRLTELNNTFPLVILRVKMTGY